MMRLEHVDRRALGAVQIIDATTRARIVSPLKIEADTASFVRNRSGFYVITRAQGLEDHLQAFNQPPAAPALGSLPFEIRISDPSKQYLPRRSTIRLPRDPDPTHADQDASLFRALDIELFPSPTAQSGPGWAIIRASLTKEGTDAPLAGALIRVTRASDAKLLARGLSDKRGEAMVCVPGIPVTTFEEGEGAVTTKEIDVSIEVIFDANAAAPPDPDELEKNRANLPKKSFDRKLASGRALVANLKLP